ncbi:MAG: hypothetical protein ACREIU_02855 [Planctomycetota bacterium]
MESASRRRGRGFSILGLTVLLGLITLLAGLLIPGATGPSREGRAARIVDLYEKVVRGTQAFYADTTRLPVELGTADASLPGAHHLSLSQELAGWAGPYIASPITAAAHPCGGSVFLLDRTDAAPHPTGPFDLLGDRRLTEATASVLVLTGVDEALARRVDLSIDRALPGPWHRVGRVQFTGSDLEILVFSPPSPLPPAGAGVDVR